MKQEILKDLKYLRDKCIEYAGTNKIHSIIIYGSYVKYCIGKAKNYKDYDINIFFVKGSKIKSTYGKPKRIGIFKGKVIEIWRNIIPKNKDLFQYIKSMKSKRWKRIRNEPIILLFPKIKLLKKR